MTAVLIAGARIACDSGADRDVDTGVNRGEVIVAPGQRAEARDGLDTGTADPNRAE